MYLIFILLLSLPALSFGQDMSVTGTVISSGDQLPLAGATVIVKGTSTGAVTDFDGLQVTVSKAGLS